MRQMPDKKYSPNTPRCNNMTVYEMAYSMDDSVTPSAQVGFPALINWLFSDIYDYFQYTLLNDSNIELDDLLKMKNVVAFFMYNFINREICSKDPLVFRSKMCKELVNMFLDFDLYNKLKDVADATTVLNSRLTSNKNIGHTGSSTRTDNLTENIERDVQKDGTTSRDVSHSGSNTRTDNLTENIERDVTNSLDSTSDTTSTSASSANATDTRTLNTLKTDNSTDSTNASSNENSNSRSLGVDYPQSTANHSQIGQWDYASDATDNTSDRTTQNVTSTTTNATSADTGTISDARQSQVAGNGHDTNTLDSDSTTDENVTKTNTGTQGNIDSYTDDIDDVTSENTDENITKTNTGTQGTVDTYADNVTNAEIHDYNTLSDLESLSIKVKLLDEFKSIYRKLNTRFENCFISIYVDEDRDGWIDPSVIWEV